MQAVEVSKIFPDERNSDLAPIRRVQLVQLRILKIIDYICCQHNILYWLDGGTLLGAVRHKGFIPWDDDIDIVMPRSDYEKFIKIAKEELPEDLYIETFDAHKNYYMPCKIVDKYSKITETHDNFQDIGKGIYVDITPLDGFNTSFPLHHTDLLLKKIYRSLIKVSNKNSKNNFKFHFFIHKILTLSTPFITPDTPILAFRHLVARRILAGKKINTTSTLIGYGFDSNWIRLFKTTDIFPLKKIIFENHTFFSPKNTHEVLKIFYGEKYMEKPPIKDRRVLHISKVIIDTRTSFTEQHVSYFDSES